MTYKPKETVVNGIACKVMLNWKLVQVSGQDKVGIVDYDDEGNRVWQTSPVARVNGDMVQTESGSYYLLRKENMHGSLWQLGLQMKRPAVYDRLKATGII
jgi:hypothetical protein